MHWDELLVAIRNTILVGTGTVVVAVPVGTLLALLILRTNVIGARWAWLLISSQLLVPLYVFAGGWSAGFGTLGWWPLAPANMQALEVLSLLAVWFIHSVAAIPWVCLIISLGLVWSARSLEDLALVESGWYAALGKVTLPRLGPWVALASIWSVLPVLTEMVVTNLYQVRTLPEQVYLDISLSGTSKWTYAAGLVGGVMPLSLGLLLILKRLPVWLDRSSYSPHHLQNQPVLDLRNAKVPASLVVWCLVLVLVGVPILNLIYKAGWEVVPDSIRGSTHRWTWDRLWLTISETATGFATEAYWTALLAAGAASLAMLLSVVLAFVGRQKHYQWSIYFVCILLLSVPGPLAGQWITWLFDATSSDFSLWLYDRTLVAPILAQQFRLFPLAFLLVNGILCGIDRRTWELAEVDSMSYLGIIRFIILPQVGGAFLVAWVALVAFSAGELSTNLLLLPPGVTTIAQRLFEFLHFGMRYQDSGLCLALLLVGWLVALLAWNTRKGFQ